jgi:hypothetical protein
VFFPTYDMPNYTQFALQQSQFSNGSVLFAKNIFQVFFLNPDFVQMPVFIKQSDS